MKQGSAAFRVLGRCLVIVALAVCTSCDSANPTTPGEVVRYDPPGIYRFWWTQLRQEAGLSAAFPSVSWYEVLGGEWRNNDGEWIHGLWRPGEIYLAVGLTRNEGAVKHEMLHELLRGDPQHTHPLFALYYLWRPLP